MEVHQRLGVSGDVGMYYWSMYSLSFCLKFAVKININNHSIYFNDCLSEMRVCCS